MIVANMVMFCLVLAMLYALMRWLDAKLTNIERRLDKYRVKPHDE